MIPILMLIMMLVFSACGAETAATEHVHNWERATCTNPRTCTECGKTKGNALEHQWYAATCTSPKTCSICQKTDGYALGHQLSVATYNDPPTCKVCGATEGSAKLPGAVCSMKNMVSKVKASSVYSGDNLGKHGPKNLYDGDLRTNWTENVSGAGIGESVTFTFDQEYAIKELQIYTGSHYNEAVFKQNCRPKTIRISFSNGSAFSTGTIELDDTYDQQTITFDEYYYADTVTITIEDVYFGTQYQDTVIAELNFVAYLP